MVRCFMEGMSVKEKITQGSCFLLTGALGWMSPELPCPHVAVSDPHVMPVPAEGTDGFIHELANHRKCAQVRSLAFGGAASHHKKHHDSENSSVGYSVSH